VVLSRGPQGEAETVLRRLVTGIERERLLEVAFRLIEVARLQQRVSKAVVGRRARRLKLDRVSKRRQRFREQARLEQRSSQLSLSIEAVRIGRRKLSIPHDGFVHSPLIFQGFGSGQRHL